MKPITLTTDFGLSDWFVGAMKGVIAGIAPHARVVDLTHGVAPGDISGGAFALAAAYRCFPRGTIHVAVVDPGVGSARPAIAVRTDQYFYVGPDNGVLSLAVARETIREIRRLENPRFFLPEVSRTFHGRDIFAPVAAHLSRAAGRVWRQLGPVVRDFQRLPWPECRNRADGFDGEVFYVDRFGNGITNLAAEAVAEMARDGVEITVGGRRIGPLVECYAAVPAGQPLAVVGSSGFLEIAVNGGSAAARLGLRRGTRVSIRRAVAVRESAGRRTRSSVGNLRRVRLASSH